MSGRRRSEGGKECEGGRKEEIRWGKTYINQDKKRAETHKDKGHTKPKPKPVTVKFLFRHS